MANQLTDAKQASECHLFKVYTTKECTDMLSAKSGNRFCFDVGILGRRARSAAAEDGAEPHQKCYLEGRYLDELLVRTGAERPQTTCSPGKNRQNGRAPHNPL